MIDEKDIQKAAELTYDFTFDEDANLYTRSAFVAGVEWFKKAIWHNQNEIPEYGKIILVKGWYDCRRSRDYYIVIDTAEDINYNDINSDRNYQWGCFCSYTGTPITWCYIDDLLPSKEN